jgi:K+-transporting ATPase A subunit
MIWTIIGILLLLWLVGVVAHIGGGIIYILLVVAAAVFIWDLLVGRRV